MDRSNPVSKWLLKCTVSKNVRDVIIQNFEPLALVNINVSFRYTVYDYSAHSNK
jgi:hypothetical protein